MPEFFKILLSFLRIYRFCFKVIKQFNFTLLNIFVIFTDALINIRQYTNLRYLKIN